jgi:hypothetical protein
MRKFTAQQCTVHNNYCVVESKSRYEDGLEPLPGIVIDKICPGLRTEHKYRNHSKKYPLIIVSNSEVIGYIPLHVLNRGAPLFNCDGKIVNCIALENILKQKTNIQKNKLLTLMHKDCILSNLPGDVKRYIVPYLTIPSIKFTIWRFAINSFAIICDVGATDDNPVIEALNKVYQNGRWEKFGECYLQDQIVYGTLIPRWVDDDGIDYSARVWRPIYNTNGESTGTKYESIIPIIRL